MTDIVKRLREGLHDQEMETMLTDLLYEGADDIERLRELLKRFVEYYDEFNPVRTADVHWEYCPCMRCVRDAAEVELRNE